MPRVRHTRISLEAQLVTDPRGIARSQYSRTSTAPVAPGGSVYVTMPPLAVSPRAKGFDLEVSASAPGVTRAATTLHLVIQG